MEQMSFDFSRKRPVLARADSNDYHRLPVSDKQRHFAQTIARRLGVQLTPDVLTDRDALSKWIDQHKDKGAVQSRFSRYPSSKQVAFAERIARMKRRAVPDECFKDKQLMSRWIDSNL